MIIALGFLIPCLLYFIIFTLCSRKSPLRPWLGISSLVLTVIVAIVSSLTVFVVLRFFTNWSARTQFEWTGVEFVGQQFTMGGEPEKGIVGWPNESFLPEVKFWTTNHGKLGIEISGGQAFLYDEKQNTFLNGDVIPPGSVKSRGDFSIQLSRHYYLWQRIDVLDSANQVWASFDLPAALIRRSQVYSLAERVGSNAVPGIRENPLNIVKLENWADGLRLLLTRQGEIRLLDDGSRQAECELPCSLTLVWINRRQPFEINQSGARLTLCFPPPRQFISPIPPPSPTDNSQQVILTASPRPGDFAFTLPLGRGIPDPRRPITFGKDQNGMNIITSPGASLGERGLPYLPERVQPEVPSVCTEKGVTSSLAVQSGNAIFNFATVNDLPNLRLLVFLQLLVLICFVMGLLLLFPRMPDDRTRWFLYALMGTLWNLLTFRLLLSLRYALSLSSVDSLVVKGVVTALVGLAVVPGIVVLVARFKRDIQEKPRSDKAKKLSLIFTLAYLVILFGVIAAEYVLAPSLWINLPQRFAVGSSSPITNYILLGVVGVAFLYFVVVSFALYKTEGVYSPKQRKKAIKIFLWPFSDFARNFARRSKQLWTSTEVDQPWPRLKRVAFLIFVVLIAATFFLLPRLIAIAASVISKLVPIETFVQDLLVPILFFWPLAILWLASKYAFPPGTKLSTFRRIHKNPILRRKTTRVLLLAFATITVPVFLLPVGINDVGSILGALAIMLPTIAILLASPSRRWGAIALLAICIGLGGAIYYYANIGSISPYLPQGIQVASSRLLVFKEGNRIQRLMPFTSVFGGHLQNLRQGYQHTWENQAIAYEGGLLGLGFGNAPTERSQVRQDTIQYDSVFSFFIASEHGLIGGLLLLLLFAMPLMLVLLVARTRFDLGHAIAAVAASSLLLEALFHVGMNLNLLPFTGRNLPLLSVNSISDLTRWTILLSFIVVSVLSKYRKQNDLRENAISLLTPKPTNQVVQAPEAPKRYASLIATSCLLPFLLSIGVLVTSFQIWRDQSKQLSSPFTWNGVLDTVDRMARDGLIIVKPDNTLTLKPSLSLSAGVLLDQEIARFNALSPEERTGQATSATLNRVKDVRSRAEYDRLLNESREKSLEYRRSRTSLFELLPPLKWNDGTAIREIPGYRLVANREFNTQVSFKVGMSEHDFPRTTFRDEQAPLIGPAWVRGKWIQTFDPDPAVPWTEILKGVLEAEWKRLGTNTAKSRYSVLSLDRTLQEVTSAFVARKGLELHDQHLKRKHEMTALPPRVALSVLDITSGEVLAMGGWPRMTSGRFWKKSNQGNEWFPPAQWLQEEAPDRLRLLYEGDRNFDRMVMGSATKPLWAVAVLNVHPELHKTLATRGTETTESDPFGIQFSSGWDVHPTPGWIDFRTYLADSDNRYHVRLGLLGLAETMGGPVVGDGLSSSNRESLSANQPVPWKKFPRFPPEINFSKDQSDGPFRRLNESELANSLQSFFSIGVTEHQIDFRRSFWTKDESDDLSQSIQNRAWLSVFNGISPVAVDLGLDKIGIPRDYISLLLGGGTNLWANPDFAAAFGSCVTGQPIVAHVVRNQEPVKLLPQRKPFTDFAAKVRPGLMAVLTEGTGDVVELRTALASLKKSGTKIYAKTGTLASNNDSINTSRIVLAIINWEDESNGKVKAGLVISLVVERGGTTSASRWLGNFILDYRSDLERLLGS